MVWVFVGGGVGSCARFLLGAAWARWGVGGWPIGTLTVNLLGSLGLAALMSMPTMRPELRVALGSGMMGGFTTYSTFNLETVRMVEAGRYAQAFAYLMVTVLGAFLAGLLGLYLGRLGR